MILILSSLQMIDFNSSLLFSGKSLIGYIDKITYYRLQQKKAIKVLLLLCAIKANIKSYTLETEL